MKEMDKLREYEFTDGSTLSVGTMYCIGKNYALHAKEMGGELPSDPLIFIKPASAYVPDGGEIILPSFSKMIHHEVELVVVIGKDCSNVVKSDSVQYIAGIGVGIDLTLRDIQNKAKARGEPWAVSKGFRTSAPISSIIPIKEINDITSDYILELKVNGETRQYGSTKDMERNIPELIEYLSSVFELRVGDCIFTGTPHGVGSISAGDKLYAELKGLAHLNVTVK